MSSNIKIISTALIAVGLGLVLGYFLFAGTNGPGNGEQQMESSEAMHDHTTDPTPGEEAIWTCSMHPQIRQNEPGDCPICGMDLIKLDQNTSNDPLVLEMTEASVKLANIQTTIVGQSSADNGKTLRLSGKVQEDERLAASLVAHVPGRIEQLFVTFEGQQVNKGQKIASIYAPDLISAQRELLEAIKLQAINPALVEAARDKLRYWKIDEETIANIETNGTIQETFSLFAQASGIVTNKKVAVGDYVRQGGVLFDIIGLNKVWVLFDAYEEDLANISIGDAIEFKTTAVPNRTFKTRVTFIDPVIDPQTRVASVRTEVNNSRGLLKPEMLVYGTLQKKSSSQASLTVPKSAVLWTGKRSVVYIKVPDITVPSYQFRIVEIGDAIGQQYAILSGLEAGEEVVTNGSFTIDAAAQLNNQASMMNQDVKIKQGKRLVVIPDFTAVTPIEFKRQLEVVTEDYLLLKDALVNTDPNQAGTSANKLLTALSLVDMSLVKNEAHVYWMEQLNALSAHTAQISEAEDIEVQREQFNFLSQAMINSVKAFGLPEATVYIQHCPMANNDQGADWISVASEIRNPYFGDAMMTCGVVKETIKNQNEN